MFAPATTHRASQENTSHAHRSRRPWIIAALIILAIPAFYAIIFSIYWPFKKQDLIGVLQQRSLRTVTIERFHTTYFPPGCVAEGIRFLRVKHKDKPPLMTIQRLVVSTPYTNMLTFQHRLGNVRVIGLHVSVPAEEPEGEPSPVMPLTFSGSNSSMPVANLYADAAVIDVYRKNSPRPLRVVVQKLAMHNIASNTPLSYQVELYNSEPPGVIQSAGSFGPWSPKNPGSTPVSGSFTYQNANLAFFHELKGTLSSKASFKGTFAAVDATGSAEVQDFALAGASHKRRLAANYDATVNIMNADIHLNRVMTNFDNTSVLFTGSIAGEQGQTGKTLSLDMSSNHARLEDLLNLVTSSKEPSMTGNISFSSHVKVHEPSPEPFLRALALTAAFGVDRGKFTNARTEQALSKLSQSAHPGKDEPVEPSETVLSDLRGQIEAADGIAHLSHVEFQVPGAHAWLDGTFNLLNCQNQLFGTLITTGNVSDTQTGIKSFFLKALTPFFQHKGHAKVVPFKITGPYGNTKISLDMASSHK